MANLGRFLMLGLLLALAVYPRAAASKKGRKRGGAPGQKTKDTDCSSDWVGAADPDGGCHTAPDEIDPCDTSYHINPDVRPLEATFPAANSLVTEQVHYSLAQVICYGIKYLGSEEAVIDELRHADSSSFRINGTDWKFNFPHENYRRIFFAESKILNANQNFEDRIENQKGTFARHRNNLIKKRKRGLDASDIAQNGQGDCPPEIGDTACSWARTFGNGIPMITESLDPEVEGVMIDTGELLVGRSKRGYRSAFLTGTHAPMAQGFTLALRQYISPRSSRTYTSTRLSLQSATVSTLCGTCC